MRYALILSILCLSAFTEDSPKALRVRYYDVTRDVTGHGTCFMITSGEVITAAHNVIDKEGKPRETLMVECGDGTRAIEWHVALVRYVDKNVDLAVLHVCNVTSPYLEPKNVIPADQRFSLAGNPPWNKDRLKVLAFPLDQSAKELRATIEKKWHDGQARHLLKIEDFQQGCSGAPVVDRDGDVIGVAVAGTVNEKGQMRHDECLVVPLEVVKSVLQDAARDEIAKEKKKK